MRYLEILLVVFCLAMQCWAIPAPDDTFIIRQPDGTELEARWLGDENFHVLATADGQIILEDVLGYYSYANEKGEPSGIYARNPADRSAQDLMFLLTLNQESIFETLWKEAPKVETLDYRTPEYIYRDVMRMPTPNTKLTIGDIRGLVVLVQFSDVKFKSSNAQAQFVDYMNKEGYNEYHNIGSVRDYFYKNSMGVFRPTFDVYGPVTLSGTRESYGGVKGAENYPGGRKALSEALDTLIKWGTVDFSKYDNDGDGYVDFVYMFYAGIGSNYSGNTKAIWPHAWVFSPIKYLGSGKRVERYACSNEIDGSAYQYNSNTDVLGGIGNFVHEFGHVLGLPDLYDRSGEQQNKKATPKEWDVMDQGVYNCPWNTARSKNCTPPYFSAFERMSLGWMTPTELYAVGEVRLDKLDDNVAYSITNPENPDEIFLLEYRTKQTWDQGHKNSGILLWHIDYVKSVWEDRSINNDGDHMYVDIEEAVPNTGTYSLASDVFPGTGNVKEFEDFTFWDGSRAQVRIYDISESSDKTFALFKVDMEVESSSSEASSSSAEESSSSKEASSSSEVQSSSSEEILSSSSNGAAGFASKTFDAGNVSVLRQGNTVLVQLSRHGKNTVRLFGLNGNVVYEKSFEGDRIAVPLSTNMGKQTFVLTVEQDGVLLTTRQIR